MIYAALCILFLFITRKDKHSVLRYLFVLLLASVIAAFLSGRLQEEPIEHIGYELYMAIVLCILFSAWRPYSNVQGANFSDIQQKRLNALEPKIMWLNVFVFVLDLYIFINVFSMLAVGLITVAEHKNEGGAAEVFATLVPKIMITLSNFLNPFAMLSLVFHFYFLIKRNIKKSLLHLFLSFGSVLSGLMALSRANLINYILTYVGIYFFLSVLFPSRLVKKVKIVMLMIFALIAFVFMSLTTSRFGEYENEHKEAIVDARKYPEVLSMLNYYSQWINAAPIILEKYKPEYKSWGMYNSFGLGVNIQRVLYGTDAANVKIEEKIDKVLGSDASAFHGVVARCVYDFGYIGTVVFILIHCYLIRKFGPRGGIVSFKTILSIPILLMFCVGFFSGNVYSSLSVDLSIIYMWVFYFLIKNKRKVIA